MRAGKFARVNLDFSQTCLSLPVTNDGCPISARFCLPRRAVGQMWDSTDLDRLTLQGGEDHGPWGSVAVEKAAGPARRNPTSAPRHAGAGKTGQIWGTRHLLPVERGRFVAKFRLKDKLAFHLVRHGNVIWNLSLLRRRDVSISASSAQPSGRPESRRCHKDPGTATDPDRPAPTP